MANTRETTTFRNGQHAPNAAKLDNRKPGQKSNGRKKISFDSAEEKRKDESVIGMIRVLDLLIAEATHAGMGTASRILYTAKEDLVYWSAKLFFHEEPEEKFIYSRLYNNDLFVGWDFLMQLASSQSEKA